MTAFTISLTISFLFLTVFMAFVRSKRSPIPLAEVRKKPLKLFTGHFDILSVLFRTQGDQSCVRRVSQRVFDWRVDSKRDGEPERRTWRSPFKLLRQLLRVG